jgi:hypothetical protein
MYNGLYCLQDDLVQLWVDSEGLVGDEDASCMGLLAGVLVAQLSVVGGAMLGTALLGVPSVLYGMVISWLFIIDLFNMSPKIINIYIVLHGNMITQEMIPRYDTHSGVIDQAFSEGEATGAFATVDVHGGVVLELLVERSLHHLVRASTTTPPISIDLRLGADRRAAGIAPLNHDEGLLADRYQDAPPWEHLELHCCEGAGE